MIATRHPNTTRWLGAPRNWVPKRDGTCDHLAISDIQTTAGIAMESYWEPTPAEMAMLMGGGRVRLTIVGAMHPPVMIDAVPSPAEGPLIVVPHT